MLRSLLLHYLFADGFDIVRLDRTQGLYVVAVAVPVDYLVAGYLISCFHNVVKKKNAR